MWKAEALAAEPLDANLMAPASGLRLALFSGNYNYTRDGANQALNRLVGYLERAGAAVRVYSPTTPTPAFSPCGELVSVPSIRAPGRPEYRLALGLPRAIREDVVRFAPTAVHLSAPDLLGFQAQKLARRLGAPVVASLHTRFETYLSYYGMGWLQRLVERHLHAFYAGCDRVVAPNIPMAELLEGDGHERVGVWSRGVDHGQFSAKRRDLAWRRSLGFKDDDVVVLFLGRVVMEKGLDVFADTMARLRQEAPGVRALVVGDGPAASWFRARMPDAVFTGALTGDALGRAVASADILLNPSLTETFGNATLESMASSLAVVCPVAPSTRELLRDDVNGVVVEDPDAENYSRVLAELAADPDRRHRLGAAARQSSLAYDWDAVCRTLLNTYREVGAVAPHGRTWSPDALAS